MTFQASVNYDFGFGIPGEIVRAGPQRAKIGMINSASALNNVFGRAFTRNVGTNTVGAGGTGVYYGILANPKEHASGGLAGAPLSPNFALNNLTQAAFAEMSLICVALVGTAKQGDTVNFNQADGTLSALTSLATFTASQAAGVLTVSAISGGNLGIGSVVTLANGTAVGTITSLGSGTGGVGTYNLNTSATVASQAMVATSVIPAGFTQVPRAYIDRFDQNTAGGLALLNITN